MLVGLALVACGDGDSYVTSRESAADGAVDSAVAARGDAGGLDASATSIGRECDPADNGTSCDRPVAGTQCVGNRCTVNVCGDGVRAGDEQCDDGNSDDSDGCFANCRSAPDAARGGAQEDAARGGAQDDAASGEAPRDAAAPIAKDPPATTEPSEGAGALARSDSGTDAGPVASGGAAEAGPSANDAGSSGADAAEVALDGALPDADASTGRDADRGTDSGDAAGNASAERGDADASSDDSGGDAAGGNTSADACEQCRAANCRNFQDTDLVAGCFETVNPALGAPAGDATFLEQCTNMVRCAHENGCAWSESKQAAECYCGSNALDTCARSGPAADAKCLEQWQRGTRANANADVHMRMTDLSYPSGWAYFLLECERTNCAGSCTHPR